MGVRVLEDESDPGRNFIVQECEHCKQLKPARKVPTVGHMQESRGAFTLCFDCFGPQLIWQETGLKNPPTITSPCRRARPPLEPTVS